MAPETYRNPAVEHAAEGPPTVTVLPDGLADQIAAGEVVERPASVVKELVENSLDAGANEIELEVDDGGRERVRVRDNGCGMRREDLIRAVERHATSKIGDEGDLESIGTLGFRGEALPSIGAVSRLEIKSKPHGELDGTRIYVEGGELQEVEDVGMKAGTVVTADDLFFNTPARRKFLKAASAESRRITRMTMRMGLSRPDVRFTYVRDGDVKLDLPRVDDLEKRILEVLGREVYDAMYPTYEYPAIDGVVARGYFSEPSHTQRTSTNIYTYVNGRYVDDATISAAIRKGYGELLEGGRYPSVVLFVEVPYELIDVNVHPAKTEVRFRDTQPVFRAVYHAISDALAETPWVDDTDAQVYELDDGPGDRGASGKASDERGEDDEELRPEHAQFEPLNARSPRQSQQEGGGGTGTSGGGSKPFFRQRDNDNQRGFSAQDAQPLGEPPTADVGEEPPDAEEDAYFATLRVIGQFKRQYIVCEDRNGLLVIDQHAAHERIAFEELRELYRRENDETQTLMFGQRVELDPERADCLESHLDFFADAGFEVDHFGGQSYAIKTVPAVLEDADAEALLRDAIDELAELGQTDRVEEALESVLSRMACHSVVRGPTPLNREECEALLEQMDRIDFRANCPHGRPVYYRIPLTELEKSFDRK